MDHPERRETEYRNAISQTLSLLPPSIKPIIVENNGQRPTWLTTVTFQNQPIRVIYTDHNQHPTKNKGITELMDLHMVIEQCNLSPEDIIIKLTGRYYPLSPYFFETVIREQHQFDAWIRFYNVTYKRPEQYDCVLGMYAIRCSYLMCWNPLTVPHSISPEVAFARYVRFSGALLREIEHIYLQCVFSKDGEVLEV
jgi:hypothetical protein